MRSTWSTLITSLTVGSPVARPASAEQIDAVPAEALERVRVGPRLEGAAPQHHRAARAHGLGGGEDLLARLDRARAGDDDELAAADERLADADLGAGRLRLARGHGVVLGGGRGQGLRRRRRGGLGRRGRRRVGGRRHGGHVVAAEEAELGAEAPHLLERGGDGRVRRVTLEVGVEHVLPGAPRLRPRLELGEVDAGVGERGEAAREEPVLVRGGEEHRGAPAPGGARRAQLGTHRLDEEEAGDDVGRVGDVRGELDQAVASGRLGRRDGRDVRILGLGHVARCNAGVDRRRRARAGQGREELAALLEHDRVRLDAGEPRERGARHAQEAVLHAEDHLAYGGEIVLGHEVVTFAEGAGDGVLHGEDPEARAARQQRDRDVAERGHAQRLHRLAARGEVPAEEDIGVRAFNTLVCSRDHRALSALRG